MDYPTRYNRNRVALLYDLARAKNVSSNAVRVGLLFATFCQPEGREIVSPAYEWIMSAARLKSRSTLSKALEELEKAGFLRIERFHRYRNQYSLPFDENGDWKPLSPKNGL